jgi:hypothetical protein
MSRRLRTKGTVVKAEKSAATDPVRRCGGLEKCVRDISRLVAQGDLHKPDGRCVDARFLHCQFDFRPLSDGERRGG